jgi:hypothetical protein
MSPRVLRRAALAGAVFVAPLALHVMSGLSLVGCTQRTVTPAELEKNGTRPYAGETPAQVMKATVVALKTLGYEVTLADESTGKVKTAPKVVQLHAYGNAYSATGVEDSLAWNIEIASAPDGSVIHARPKAYRNGVALDDTNMTASYMDRAFTDLFHEIEDNMPGYKPPPPVASASAAPSASASSAPPEKKQSFFD